MSERKLLFFDVDGTIVSGGPHIVPESARRALSAARARGHLLVVNTGRPYLHVEPQIKALPFHGYICSLGGYILWEGAPVFYRGFADADCRRVLSEGRKRGMLLLLESEQGVWCDQRWPNAQAERELRFLAGNGVPAHTGTDAPGLRFDKFVAWPGPEGDPAGFQTALADALRFIPREHGMLEAVAKGLSKAAGIRFLAERLGFDRADIFAFGDGPNDLDMLRAAGTGVLMGNAPRELWPEADYVTAALNDDGLAKALLHLRLI